MMQRAIYKNQCLAKIMLILKIIETTLKVESFAGGKFHDFANFSVEFFGEIVVFRLFAKVYTREIF